MASVSASVNLPFHHKIQKFSSGTGLPGWSRKTGRKTVVMCGVVMKLHFVAQFIFLNFCLFVILQSIQRLSFTTKMADSSHFVSAHLTSNKFKNRLVNVLPCE